MQLENRIKQGCCIHTRLGGGLGGLSFCLLSVFSESFYFLKLALVKMQQKSQDLKVPLNACSQRRELNENGIKM